MKDAVLATAMPRDGLLRLSIHGLQALQPVHLASGIYEDPVPLGIQDCGCRTTITGYTEWIDSAGSPASLGWDWEICCTPKEMRWQRLGLPFTNVLLVDDSRCDFSWQHNLAHLGVWLDAMAWIEPVRAALFLYLPRARFWPATTYQSW